MTDNYMEKIVADAYRWRELGFLKVRKTSQLKELAKMAFFIFTNCSEANKPAAIEVWKGMYDSLKDSWKMEMKP